MKKSVLMGGVLGALLLTNVAQSHADGLIAKVNISTQTMTVSRYGEVLYRWNVSTARKGYVTPSGSWKPKRLHKMWYSKKYDNSPMPWSVFYHGGYAVHGTNAVRQLGRPASHGCVRLATANAATFYSLVREVGMKDTRIVITY